MHIKTQVNRCKNYCANNFDNIRQWWTAGSKTSHFWHHVTFYPSAKLKYCNNNISLSQGEITLN